LNRKLEADIAVNMEKKKKGEQFRILDYAKMPEKPVYPDLRKIFAFSLAAGLGVGFGILFLFDMLNTSIQRKEEMETLGVPVLVTIPKIYDERAKRWMRVNSIASICALLAGGVITAVFAFEAFIKTGLPA
jgi:capsular polysaccharide biosynthesis protein